MHGGTELERTIDLDLPPAGRIAGSIQRMAVAIGRRRAVEN